MNGCSPSGAPSRAPHASGRYIRYTRYKPLRKSHRAERHVRDRRARRLPVDEVTVHEGVLEERNHRVDVITPHLANVLEEERERLEHAVLHLRAGVSTVC